MPFRSQSQRRFFYAAEARGDLPEGTAAKWESETPKGKKLPKKVKNSEKKAKELILGGLADYKPDRFYSKDQLQKGVKVELEHVDSKDKAKEIAKDHLEEQRREGEGPKEQDYYDKLLKMEGKKHAADEETEQQQVDTDPNSTMAAVSPRLPLKTIEESLKAYLYDKDQLESETVDPETGESAATPEQQSKLDWLVNITDGLQKVIRQRKYVIKDTLTGGQINALKDTNTLTTGDKHASTAKKVSPHGKELMFPETNTASTAGSTPDSIRKLKAGGGNVNATMGRQAHMAGSQPLSNPTFTGFGDIASHPAQANEKYSQEQQMDAYDQRLEDLVSRKTPLVDPSEVKVAFFFEGLADSLEKDAYVVENPEAFFTGVYESLRDHFEGNAKLASGVYGKHVVNACQLFKDRMVKMANGFSGLAPVNPLDPNAAQQAQENALGVSPQRQEKRQDIIDALLPSAETISLDPDGKIKLKMPSPETHGVMDPQLMEAQQQAEMQGRTQAQGAAQQPIEQGQEDPAAAQLAQGEGAEVSNEDGQMPQQNADSSMMGGEGGSPEEAMLQQILQGGAGGGASAEGAGGPQGIAQLQQLMSSLKG